MAARWARRIYPLNLPASSVRVVFVVVFEAADASALAVRTMCYVVTEQAVPELETARKQKYLTLISAFIDISENSLSDNRQQDITLACNDLVITGHDKGL